ncbi:MAG: Tn3 family transposase [Desulfobacterales bacterium]|nr:MAG: Tn3 family transposase [Desulfobacterales bacterium]
MEEIEEKRKAGEQGGHSRFGKGDNLCPGGSFVPRYLSNPRERYTDSHGYTDIVFALAYLPGFRRALRMAKTRILP